MRAARSEYQPLRRGIVSFRIELARGRVDIAPEQAATVKGFKAGIDDEPWTVHGAHGTRPGR